MTLELKGFTVTAKESNGGTVIPVPKGRLISAEFATRADGGMYYCTLSVTGKATEILGSGVKPTMRKRGVLKLVNTPARAQFYVENRAYSY